MSYWLFLCVSLCSGTRLWNCADGCRYCFLSQGGCWSSTAGSATYRLFKYAKERERARAQERESIVRVGVCERMTLNTMVL